jgi:dephospho-CoA kinase
MIRLGLTGSIGMGKSVTAGLFAEAGVPVFDSDAAVHALYAPGGRAVESVGAAFPGVVVDGAIVRPRLAERVMHDDAARRRLEVLVHPLVAAERQGFLQAAQAAGADVAVLDVPLLFETGADVEADAVVVVSASPEIQRARVLARQGMTAERLDAILALQMPDAEKRRRADFVIDTGHGLDHAASQVQAVLEAVRTPGFRSRRPRPRATLDGGAEPPH